MTTPDRNKSRIRKNIDETAIDLFKAGFIDEKKLRELEVSEEKIEEAKKCLNR